MPVAVRAKEKVGQLIVPDLEELLSLPESEPNLALSMMPGAIDDMLRTILNDNEICKNCFRIGLEKLRYYRVTETLGAIEAARDLNFSEQIIRHTRAYVGKMPSCLTMAVEETFKLLVLRQLNLRTKVWGRELNADGFVRHHWWSTIPVAIPKKALQLVRDRINPCRNLMPFYTGELEVMTKGADPFVVMLCQYGVAKVKLAFFEWDER